MARPNYCLLGFAINGVATVAFGLLWGGWGVIAATVLGLVVSSYVLLVWMDRWLGSSGASAGWTAIVAGPRRASSADRGSIVGVGFAQLVVTSRESALLFFVLAGPVAASPPHLLAAAPLPPPAVLQPSENSR